MLPDRTQYHARRLQSSKHAIAILGCGYRGPGRDRGLHRVVRLAAQTSGHRLHELCGSPAAPARGLISSKLDDAVIEKS